MTRTRRARTPVPSVPVASCVLLVGVLALMQLGTPDAQAQEAGQAGALPRVVVLATGGTIASTYDEEIGALQRP